MQLIDNTGVTILIRADASQTIGTGHIFRCLALADEARALGVRVIFVCRDVPGNLKNLLIDRQYEAHLIPENEGWEADAQATVSIIRSLNLRVTWLLVDHYLLDSKWEKAVRPYAARLATIDDLADRAHDVDLLVDCSHDPSSTSIYDGLLPPSCQRAIGSAYTLLRREFFETPRLIRVRAPAKRILVTLGGNDPFDTTSMVLDALEGADLSNISIDVTLGTSNPRLEALKRRAEAMDNVTAYVQHSRMSELMLAADLCVGAGGMTALERCYLGLPSLILMLADNQRELAAQLDRDGCARNLGFVGGIDVQELRRAIVSAAADVEWLAQSSRRGQEKVDGKGVLRILGLMNIAQPLSANGSM